MRRFRISKRSGGHRTIYAPSRSELPTYRSLVGRIARQARDLDRHGVMHGFVTGRSPVTNARAHIGHAWSVSFDIVDFFDHVTEEKLRGKLPREVIDRIVVDGAARQGIPTSPAAANVAAATLDRAISRWIDRSRKGIVYTRYADDLTLSGDTPEAREAVLHQIPQIVRRSGWQLRLNKTHVQLARHGRRHICGVAVGDHEVYPTRAIRRRLRAAEHQARHGVDSARSQATGLREWCRLRPPRPRSSRALIDGDELTRLGKVWRLRIPTIREIPDRGPDIVDGDLLITGDPVYMIGCSTWTTGWTSCLSQPSGQYRRGAAWWTRAPGTRLSALLSRREMTIGGVTRRMMRARAWVHTFRDGTMGYDRVYGEEGSRHELVQRLEARGIWSVASMPRGLRTVGHVAALRVPYLDRLKAVRVTIGGEKRIAIVLQTPWLYG